MDAKTAVSTGFDANAALESVRGAILGDNREQAMAYALAELQKRMPYRSGAMYEKAGVEITDEGFQLYVRKYYAYFVEKGHRIGSRRTRRARILRNLAKDIRKARKLTGDDSLKAFEGQLRKEAKQINQEHAAGRSSVAAHPFLEPALAAALPGIIRRLAGK